MKSGHDFEKIILFIPQNVNFILDTLTSIAFSPNFIPKSAVLSDPRSRDLHFFQAWLGVQLKCFCKCRCSKEDNLLPFTFQRLSNQVAVLEIYLRRSGRGLGLPPVVLKYFCRF